VQVVADRARAQYQHRGDLTVAIPLRRQPGDSHLLRGQRGGAGMAAIRFAGRAQLTLSPTAPGVGAQTIELLGNVRVVRAACACGVWSNSGNCRAHSASAPRSIGTSGGGQVFWWRASSVWTQHATAELAVAERKHPQPPLAVPGNRVIGSANARRERSPR